MKKARVTIYAIILSILIPAIAQASVLVNNGALRYNGGQTSNIVYSEIWDNKTSFKGTVEDNVNYAVLATVKVGSTKHTSGWRIGWAKKEADRVWYANETSYYDYDVITTKYTSSNWGT